VLTDLFWSTMYRRWRTRSPSLRAGYTILLPVPGDLPVFLKVALQVCAAQRMEKCLELLVIPDKPSKAFAREYDSSKAQWPALPLRLITLRGLDAWVTRTLNNPSKNHWLQLIAGINASKSTHVLFHDADLFISEPDFVEQHYQKCVASNLDCLGVSKVWDPWYDEHGYDWLTATWEMLARVDWLRQFAPALHRGHTGPIAGTKHVFDTTLAAQCRTPRERIGRHEREFGFVHFNYVISTYRAFQNRKGAFHDDDHRLLLIRLLVDAFDDSNWPYDVPSLAVLETGASDADADVTSATAKSRQSYPGFRAKMEELMSSPVLSMEQSRRMRHAIAPFDRVFGWRESMEALTAQQVNR